VLLIEIDAANAGYLGSGVLDLAAGDSTVRGLVINHAQGPDIDSSGKLQETSEFSAPILAANTELEVSSVTTMNLRKGRVNKGVSTINILFNKPMAPLAASTLIPCQPTGRELPDGTQPGTRKGMRIGTGPVFAFERIVAARRWQLYAARSFLVSALLFAMAVIA
jgi:hypothetical protein